MIRNIRWWHIIALVIIIAGVFLTIWTAQQQDQQLRTELLTKAKIATEIIDPAPLETLTGTSSDITSPDYQQLKAKMARIRAVDPSIRFTYILGQGPEGIFFYVDSEPADSPDYSPPGQVYTEVPARIVTVFSDKELIIEGPYTDRWGTWVSAIVPVTDRKTGQLVALFGMDVDARNWNTLIMRASMPTFVATLLIVLLVLVYAFFQRRSDREKLLLNVSEEKFSKAFHANPALMVVSGTEDSRIIDVNASFLTTLGYSRNEVVGRTTQDLDLFFDPADRKTILSRVGETGQVSNIEVKLYRKNRDQLYGLLSSITIDIAGMPRLFTVIIDITARKQADLELILMNKKIALLSSITRHDISNQLTGILGYLDMLKSDVHNPVLDEYFQTMAASANRISSMIQFTKEYEKIGVSAPVWQDCRKVAETAAKEAPLGKVMVKNDFPAGTEVFADPLIVKVFYNLMDNAVRYGGKITTIRFAVEESGDDHLIVCEDDGDGVIAEEKEKIFERGFGKNTGLGLALSREILDITGITIRETGEPGKGARFEMAVPKGAWRIEGNGA